ncbi:type II toxin-antitoxin system VapC family toxin [Sphingomonas donggukensis]|uniref:Ribonuclease VapC n=1 Tax=Sphingomonas donggukensis TaxID=2949093 RepID=A0ABY4TPS9_9SPHN|nr:type II toxin-antitoxin system VapC family toxin [Sphingomonas donggukensis]URW74390.1 type II toxin-antitoxin system VapC family toxin [Sphingomonas donggukensis]
MATKPAPLYLDASVIIAMHVQEQSTAAAWDVTAPDGMTVVVSDFGMGEAASALARHVRTRLFTPAQADAAWSDVDLWCSRMARSVDVTATDVALATQFVLRYELKLRLPDAVHLACAIRLDAALATLDLRLFDAAESLGHPTVLPGA